MPKLPSNIVIRRLLVTDLSQQLKKQRDFLKWMKRRHKDSNPDQSEAFATGARLLDEIRNDLLDGLFDAEEEVFTEESKNAGLSPAVRLDNRALEIIYGDGPREGCQDACCKKEIDDTLDRLAGGN